MFIDETFDRNYRAKDEQQNNEAKD